MHDLAPHIPSTWPLARPIQKTVLEDRDLLAVARIIRQGWSEGHYLDVIPRQPSAAIVAFLRHVACECEFPGATPAETGIKARAAALLVYVFDGAVVGFAVLAEASTDAFSPAVEILMIGVPAPQRGLRFGAAILDDIVNSVSRRGFSLLVCCPPGNNFFFVILASRGFATIGRNRQGRMLLLRPDGFPKETLTVSLARNEMLQPQLDSHLPPYED